MTVVAVLCVLLLAFGTIVYFFQKRRIDEYKAKILKQTGQWNWFNYKLKKQSFIEVLQNRCSYKISGNSPENLCRRLQHSFPCDLCENFNNTFFMEHLRWLVMRRINLPKFNKARSTRSFIFQNFWNFFVIFFYKDKTYWRCFFVIKDCVLGVKNVYFWFW